MPRYLAKVAPAAASIVLGDLPPGRTVCRGLIGIGPIRLAVVCGTVQASWPVDPASRRPDAGSVRQSIPWSVVIQSGRMAG
jgi:hypothetical protein